LKRITKERRKAIAIACNTGVWFDNQPLTPADAAFLRGVIHDFDLYEAEIEDLKQQAIDAKSALTTAKRQLDKIGKDPKKRCLMHTAQIEMLRDKLAQSIGINQDLRKKVKSLQYGINSYRKDYQHV